MKKFVAIIGSLMLMVCSILIPPFGGNYAHYNMYIMLFLLFGALVLTGALLAFRKDLKEIGSIVIIVFSILTFILFAISLRSPDFGPHLMNGAIYLIFGSLISILGGVLNYFEAKRK